MFHSILVPLDGSEYSERSLPLARGIAKATGATLCLAHVHVPHQPDQLLSNTQFHFEGLDLHEYDERHRKSEREYLDSVVERCDGDGTDVAAELLEGVAADEIAAWAEDVESDVIFITTHGQTGVNRLWLGSVADALIRKTHRPMLVIHPARPGGVPADVESFEHIVVPLDGSDLAERALEPAIKMAQSTGARMTLMHIVPERTVMGARVFPLMSEALGQLTEDATAYLERVRDRPEFRGITVETYVGRDESPATGVTHAAELLGADLIALATHGYGGVRRALLGSVADKVLRASPLPLLVVRPSADA